MSTFGEWLQTERSERRLTREEFAQRVGCSVAMLRKIEADERRPSAQIAGLIANALEIAPAAQATFVRVARGELGMDRIPPVPRLSQHHGISPASAASHNNLPVLPTPLIGRQRELAELHRLASDPQCRMLTLVGPGGIGKTRLAIETASQLQVDFPDGVFFVPLASVDSSRFIVPVIAHSMGFAFLSASSADPKTQLLNFLGDKHALLLVDNIEHLLKEPDIEVFGELLAAAPGVKMLGTSRESLNLQGEWVFEVQGLPIPTDSQEAGVAQDTSIELFLQRARRAHVGFDATTTDYPAVVRICHLVNGMPLAIELAAAWVRTLTCDEIADEIERSLDFLSISARDLPPRHRSMRAVFDHSWKLLSDDERRALARLSVFRGGFGREAAGQVAGASLAMLSALVSKSLIRRPETGRYDLHEVIRQYAALELGSEPDNGQEARQQHYAFHLAMAEAATPQLKGSGQIETLRRLEQEHDNFRAALAWALECGGRDAALQLAGALRWFWQMRGYFEEGRGWLSKGIPAEAQAASPSKALASMDSTRRPWQRRTLARALEGLALLDNSVGNHGGAYALASHSAAICRELGDKQGLADALMIIGEVLRWQGDAALSRARLEEALTLFRDTGDRWSAARSLFRLGQDLTNFGGDSSARAMLEESSVILQELGDSFYLIGVVGALGVMAVNAGDYPAALSFFSRGLGLAREMSDPWGTADLLTNVGCVQRIQGDYAAADSTLREALKVYEQWGRGSWCADPQCALAENEIAQGNFRAAHARLDEACPCAEVSGNKWLQVLVSYFQGLLAYYEGDLDHAASTLGRTITLAREGQYQPDLARALVALGRTRSAQGDLKQAAASIQEGLRLFSETDSKLGITTALEALAALMTSEDAQRAARLFGAAESLRSSIGAPLPPVDRPAYERDVAAVLAQLGKPAFAKARKHGATQPYGDVVGEMLDLKF